MGCGAQSVPASGVILMPVLCADNWAMILKVQPLLGRSMFQVHVIVLCVRVILFNFHLHNCVIKESAILFIRWKGY